MTRRFEDRFRMPPSEPVRTPWWFVVLFWTALSVLFAIIGKFS